MAYKIGTKEKPMVLRTPPLTREYTMHIEQKDAKMYWYAPLVKQFYATIFNLAFVGSSVVTIPASG